MFSDKQFGLPGGLVAAVKAIMEAKHDSKDKDDVDAKKMKGGKTKVDLNPETDDQSTDSDYKKKSMKEGKEHTVPKTEKEKKLAALAHPKDKITHKDVLVGRGVVKEEDVEEATKSATYNALMADPLKNRLERLKQKEKSMAPGISADRKNLAIQKSKIQKQLANKQRNEEVEDVEEAAGSVPSVKTKEPKAEMPKKKLDWDKIQAVRATRKAVKAASHADTSHLPKGWSTSFYREDIELSDDELVEIEEALKKADPAGKWISDFVHSDDPKFKGKSPEKRKQMALAAYYAKQRNEEVDLDEASMFSSKVKQGKGAAGDVGSVRYDFGKNAAPRRPDDTGKNVLSRRVFVKGAKPKGKLPEEVDLTDEELERLEAIAQSLDEAKPTIVSAPIRGANQDQSGENTKSTSADYTISDSKKMKKEEVELDEAKRGRPRKNPAPGETPGEEDEHEHVIMQLRKVVSTHGARPVKHLDGKSTKMTPQLAQHALNKHNAMKTAAEKQDFEQKLHKSHDSMKSALGQ